MALSLPTNFKKHIQENRDTKLVPLVVITQSDGTTINLSINDIEVENDWLYGMIVKPLLLNIPSLKESIDIQDRAYRISSITLSISNVPYEGVRFSDIAIDSLINSTVYIFWYVEGQTMSDAMKIYEGNVLRYEHDDEKVKLTVEDKSQVKLHRELPLKDTGTGSSTGAASYLPDRYKNQKIPFVYGVVEKSPVMGYYGIVNPSASDIDKILELRLRADSRPIEEFVTGSRQIGSANLPISALYFYDNQSYWNVAQTTAELGSTSEITNFTTDISSAGSDIILDVDNTGYGTSEDPVNNDFSNGNLRIFYVRDFLRTEFKEVYYPTGGGYNNGDLDPEDFNLGRMTGIQFLNVPGGFNEDPPWYCHNNAWYKCYIDILTEPEKATNPTTWAFLDVTHYNYRNAGYSPDGTVNEDFDGLGVPYTKWAIWAGSDDAIQWTSGTNTQGISADEWQDYGTLNGLYYWTHFNNITGSGEILEFVNNDNAQVFSTLNRYDYVNIGIPSGYAGGNVNEDVWMNVHFTLNNAFLVHQFFVPGVADKDYYANVKGRKTHDDGTSPTAPEIIKDILSKELDQTSTLPGASSYDDWRYAFCQNEKINSKQLIENLASVSAYIPRFDYQGNFKFSEIPLNPSSTTLNPDGTDSENHTIKDSDVIDFSFGRTPYEDIVTKIEFKYNFDYARDEFLSKRIIDIDTFVCYDIDDEGTVEGYNYDYYGFESNSVGEGINHDERKLEIDDDRGKLIRDDATAERFMTWMLSWYSQQHLTMKIKLPLKYMNLEIGDIIDTDKVLGGIKPYNIDYTSKSQDIAQYQSFLPYFIITSTNKTLDSITIECTQMHYLWATTAIEVVDDVIKLLEPHGSDPTGCNYIYGCMDQGACNYDENAQLPDGSCWYNVSGCDCEDGQGAELDYCGVCNGTNECDQDCAGNYDDGSGDYGVEIDVCGVCGGDDDQLYEWLEDGSNVAKLCSCDDGIQKLWDDCGECQLPADYNSSMDGCLVCFGTCYPPDECGDDCDCDGNVLDCADECGGTALVDECGVCGGDNYDCASDEVDCECEAHIMMANGPAAEIRIDGGMNISLPLWNTESGTFSHTLEPTVIDQNDGVTEINCTHLNPNNILFNLTSGFFPAANTAMEIKVAIHIDRVVAITLEDESVIHSGGGSEAGVCVDILGSDTSNPVDFFTYTSPAGGDIGNTAIYDPNSDTPGLAFDLFQDEEIDTIIYKFDQALNFTALYKIHLTISEVNLEPEPSGGIGASTTWVPGLESQQEYLWTFQNIPNTVCSAALGDLNGDGSWNVLDVVILVNCILAENCPDQEFGCAGDMNEDGNYNVLDVVVLVNCVLAETCCAISDICPAIPGCMDDDACNYNSEANADDESCDYGTQCWDGSEECDASDCPPCPTCLGTNNFGMFYCEPSREPNTSWNRNDWDGDGNDFVGFDDIECSTVFSGQFSDAHDGTIGFQEDSSPVYAWSWYVMCRIDPAGSPSAPSNRTLHKLYDGGGSGTFIYGSDDVTGTSVCCDEGTS